MNPRLISVLLLTLLISPLAAQAEQASSLLQKWGFKRGICAVLGDSSGKFTLEMAKASEFTVYLQLESDVDVKAARKLIDAAGLLGTRIYVEKGSLKRIHLSDNIVDGLVVLAEAKVSEAEVLRVLNPAGAASVNGKELKKAYPEGAEDWQHPLYNPDNNPQSYDRLAKAPYRLQFLAAPSYAPMPQTTVASAGRVFKAYGHVASNPREYPLLNKLVAFNGYNGTILWKRDIMPGYIRKTIIATPDTLYYADGASCKMFDPRTGKPKGEIVIPKVKAGGTSWKWLALEGGVLYGIVGPDETKLETEKGTRGRGGWGGHRGWGTVYEAQSKTMFAINPKTKKIIWEFKQKTSFDGRSACLKNGRIYLLAWKEYLVCVNAKDGKVIWKKTKAKDPGMFEYLRHRTRRGKLFTLSSEYLVCGEKALYFGNAWGSLIAFSTTDGNVLWKKGPEQGKNGALTQIRDYLNFIVRDDAVFAFGPTMNSKMDALSGKELSPLEGNKVNRCTLLTGSVDSIFARRSWSTHRLDVAKNHREQMLPVRPSCTDGVTVAQGLLYWWPQLCKCSNMQGVFCLRSARADEDKTEQSQKGAGLEKEATADAKVEAFKITARDWPAFRHDNGRSASTTVEISLKSNNISTFTPQKSFEPTAPVLVGDTAYVGGLDGSVRAIDVISGKLRWKNHTGGALRYPPAVGVGRVFAGSSDGWVYCFNAKSGQRLWRKRIAPHVDKFPVFGQLISKWPVVDVLVEKGVVYAVAGITEVEGTWVYALDAVTGKTKWRKNHPPNSDFTPSVHGGLLLHAGKLSFPGLGGRSVPTYDVATGKYSTRPSIGRGSELSMAGGRMLQGGPFLYEQPDWPTLYPPASTFVAVNGNGQCVWAVSKRGLIETIYGGKNTATKKRTPGFSKSKTGWKTKLKAIWKIDAAGKQAVVMTPNAVLVPYGRTMLQRRPGSDPGGYRIVAYSPTDGKPLWERPLPAEPAAWGLAVGRTGRMIVVLRGGGMVSFGAGK